MAIGWVSVLKMVPWGDVIDNAPKVAQGAKKLWQSVVKKPDAAPGATAGVDAAVVAPASAEQLQQQLLALQDRVAELHQQMLTSSELIQSLAEQNTQLIRRVEVNRRYLWGLAVLWLLLALSRFL